MAGASARARRDAVFVDQVAVAAEAIAFGSERSEHVAVVLGLCERLGIERAAAELACETSPRGPSLEWWRCMLRLSSGLPPSDAAQAAQELARIEASGGGPPFDAERHAVRVSQAIEFLREHLRRVMERQAAAGELRGVEEVLVVVRGLKGRGLSP